ncbi:MAG TPA: carboxypeptidase regulatory-like domain-containing protein [Pyrinomonadaceae bacterium]|nr:carboxypeptidase regulatory-like domain-containing protein [Pyrinomonadaceae bacterium]
MKSSKFKLPVQLFALFFCFSCCLTVFGQSSATLQGTVSDPKGAVMPKAKIVVHNQGTGLERTTETDSEGNYQVAALPVGVYRVEVQAPGFQTQVVNDLSIEVARTVTQNFQLVIGGIEQQVSIVSDAPVIEATTTSVGTVINQKTVQDIPLNGRHFVDLGLLIPGSVTPPQNGFLTAPLRGQGSFAFNTAGNREDTVNFQINGINLNDMVQNQITFQPSINTVREFKVDNSTFSAEYGRNSGAIVNIATSSGTNDFHGELFEFLRNEALDARNFFSATKPPFKRNQFGGNLGGPIVRNKAFFFFSYEGLRQRQGLTFNSGVLTATERAGVTDTISRRLLDFIPTVNSGTNRFVGSGTAPVNIDQWTGDVSYAIGDNDRLHGYYAFQRDFRGEPNLQGNTISGFGDTRQSHRQIFTLNETHIFGPTLVNEMRFGFNRINITFTPNNPIDPSSLGINVGHSLPIGIPQITIGGIALNFGGPSGFPQGRSDTTFVLSDTLNYLRGNHSFKIGGEFRRFYNNNFNLDTGTFTFANVAAFQAGNGNGFTITLGDRSSAIGTGALGLFIQDNYKVRPGLTLELGFRYDWNMTPTERFDRFVVFDPATASLRRVGQDIDEIYNQNNKNFQPRLGIAWDPTGSGKTTVRAAYAITVDQPVTNTVTGPAANPPLATPLSFTGTINLATARATAGAAGLAPATIDHDFKNAYVQSWNLNLQRELTPSMAVMVGYFGSKGTHLRLSRNINQPINGVRPFVRLSASSPIAPNSLLGNITQIESSGNSSYNALWTTATKRLSRNFQFNASYTWSKSIDYNSLNSQGIVVQDSYNIRGDRGLSDFDARHRFVISGLYELPWRGNRLVEGWQLGTIVQLQSGNPINILAGNPLAIPGTSIGAGAGIATFTGIGSVRPDLIGDPQILGTPNQWFSNTVCDPRAPTGCPSGAVFALPVALSGSTNVYHFGSLGRNVLIGPGFKNVDFSVTKNTKLTESVRFQFRAEFFDIFNHANFGQPGRTAQVGSTAFGLISGTRFPTGDSGSSRQVQFAAKFLF